MKTVEIVMDRVTSDLVVDSALAPVRQDLAGEDAHLVSTPEDPGEPGMAR
jgi:hypothetical protein